MKVLPRDRSDIFLLIPNLLSFVFSGVSGELFNMTYRAALSNRADIFVTIAQDVCNGYLCPLVLRWDKFQVKAVVYVGGSDSQN